MPVRVVHVGDVRVCVTHPLVTVQMGMRLAGRIVRCMDMLVVLIMHVWMDMLHRLVLMFVLVILSQMQPDTKAHQQACNNELNGDGLAQEHDCYDGPDERRGREISAGSRRPEMSQSEYEQRETYAIPKEADQSCDQRW